MSPDVGAIVGISLAGGVLAVALLLFCILHLPWPCCKNEGQRRNGNRGIARPSTSSRSPFANFDSHHGSRRRSIDHLSAVDLYNQNQPHYYSSTGIVNPVWQMHCTCHSSAMLTASQQALNFSHCHPANSCQFPHQHSHNQQVNRTRIANADHSANATEPSGFQYFSPQLQSSSESPPPYPGSNSNTMTLEAIDQCNVNNSSSGPPPYSPKH